jgi:predicted dehydrogenase
MSSQAGSRTGSSADPTGHQVATSRSSETEAPVRVGLIGLDRSGQFHAELLSLRSGLEVVAACDPSNGQPRRLPGPRGADRPGYSRVDEFLAGTDFDRVLIAGPIERRADWAVQALEAGKHVAIDPPPCSNAGQMQNLLAAAHRMTRRLSILPTRRDGAEFQAALQMVGGSQLGPINSARLLSWGKAVPCAVADSALGNRTSDCEVDLFAIFAYQYVDQLLQLIREPPCRVLGRILGRSPGDPAATAFTLAIAFAPGIDGLIDVNLASGAVLQTGWMLAGARGGFSGGRIYLQEPSGEISDAPVSNNNLPEVDVYREFVAAGADEVEPTVSARDAEMVMRVLDAARESSRSGQTVALEP